MDIMEGVTEIQRVLRCHDRAVKQIHILSDYMRSLSQQTFSSAMRGNFGHVMVLMLRQSVAEGTQKMFKIYRLRKWFSVQTVVHKLSLRFHWGQAMRLLTEMDGLYSLPSTGIIDKEDVAAQPWVVMTTEFHRND
ncbi:uncharacterized protein LOC127880278 [Dreissena polymorpha]|uniref:Uncharacterized protein n=1 Tax=Dreissena polymorpha TaxID=45954 RepID=A0A9D4QI51_DREPO|nr:uncharacterized protein LOC127880278 [Dreissena polymorpha]KAH3832516.1 hypothetical protein DPMN_105806 [Dreissena polymorpha]